MFGFNVSYQNGKFQDNIFYVYGLLIQRMELFMDFDVEKSVSILNVLVDCIHGVEVNHLFNLSRH